MGKNLTSPKLTHNFFPGKNRIRKIWEKSGYEILGNFSQILVNVHRIGLIFEIKQKYFEIFAKLSIFKFEISKAKHSNFIKKPPDFFFP